MGVSFRPGPLAVAAMVCLGSVQAFGQSERKLSAREIFYGGPAAATQAAKPQTAQPPPAHAAKTQPAKPKAVAKKAPAQSPQQAPQRETASSAPVRPSAMPSDVKVIPAALGAPAGNTYPLGIRYSVLQWQDGRLSPAPPDKTYRAGDRIKLQIEVNDAGYLYIIHRGSSGAWRPLFPSPEIASGDNRVQRGKTYEIPPGHVFTFDEQPGEEKIFLVFTRQPELGLEELIYDLGRRDKPVSAPKEAPEAPAKVLMAQNRINIGDPLVDRLRTVYARDLIIEKLDQTVSPAAQENAVYVVNNATGDNSRVIADIVLIHH
jgi:hypothetical protein